MHDRPIPVMHHTIYTLYFLNKLSSYDTNFFIYIILIFIFILGVSVVAPHFYHKSWFLFFPSGFVLSTLSGGRARGPKFVIFNFKIFKFLILNLNLYLNPSWESRLVHSTRSNIFPGQAPLKNTNPAYPSC